MIRFFYALEKGEERGGEESSEHVRGKANKTGQRSGARRDKGPVRGARGGRQRRRRGAGVSRRARRRRRAARRRNGRRGLERRDGHGAVGVEWRRGAGHVRRRLRRLRRLDRRAGNEARRRLGNSSHDRGA